MCCQAFTAVSSFRTALAVTDKLASEVEGHPDVTADAGSRLMVESQSILAQTQDQRGQIGVAVLPGSRHRIHEPIQDA
jgi:hypothetical protein